MASTIEERGYRNSTVADVVRIARTSRRTFYEHFADRAHCFLALFELVSDEMLNRIAAAVDPAADWELQVEQAIDAYVGELAARPALHESLVRELPALGHEGAERQRVVLERFARMLVELVDRARCAHPRLHARPLSLEVAIALVAGLRELLVVSLQRGRDPAELRDSAREVAFAIIGQLMSGESVSRQPARALDSSRSAHSSSGASE